MAGLITFAFGGISLILIGLQQALTLLHPSIATTSLHQSSFLLSLLTALSSLVSLLLSLRDPVSSPLSLSLLLLSLLFLLHSLAALRLPLLPTHARDLLLLSAFLVELLYLQLSQRVNDAGDLENRYLDLMLVPVGVCALSTGFGMMRPRSAFTAMGRGIGLIFHGTWLLQMGFSFFTTAIAHGCMLQRKSWANYTVKCKGHAEYHRSKGIATLQFNCHLAFLVIVALGIYSAVSAKIDMSSEHSKYMPLGRIKRRTVGDSRGISQFTLGSEEDDEQGNMDVSGSGDEITMEVGNLPHAGRFNGISEAH